MPKVEVARKTRSLHIQVVGQEGLANSLQPREDGRRSGRSAWQSALAVDVHLFLLKLSKFPARKFAFIVTETTDFFIILPDL